MRGTGINSIWPQTSTSMHSSESATDFEPDLITINLYDALMVTAREWCLQAGE